MAGVLLKLQSVRTVVVLFSIGLIGCAATRTGVTKPRVNPCVGTPDFSQDLVIVDYDGRTNWDFSVLGDPVQGKPFSMGLVSPPEDMMLSFDAPVLRDLTATECIRLASLHAPVAVRLEKHRDWLRTLSRTPVPVLTALQQQATFERSNHVFQSMEAYFGLMRVHAVEPQLTRTAGLLEQTEDVIRKIREASLEVPYDYQQLERERIKVSETSAEGRSRQIRLQDGLELLLNLVPSEIPIWTAYEYNLDEKEPIPPVDHAIATALANRGDLKALEILADNAQLLSLDLLQSAPGGQGLLSSGLSLPGPAKWWQCFLKQEIECLKQKSKAERKRQLQELAKNKRQQIRLEVSATIAEINKLHELYELKLARLRILNQSIEDANKIKDRQQIDLKSHVKAQSESMELRSEIIDLRFQIETEHHRLHHLMGDSGR